MANLRPILFSCLLLSATIFCPPASSFDFRRLPTFRSSVASATTNTPAMLLRMAEGSHEGTGVSDERGLKSGQVLVASTIEEEDDDNNNNKISFDTGCVAHPVVIPPWISETKQWKLFYYGNPGRWNSGHAPLLPTGWVGLAESADGIHWEKVAGNQEYGSVLAPSPNPEDLDHTQIGHGDIVVLSKDCWYMFYFGGSQETISLGPDQGDVAGFRMRVFRAVSRDQGLTWEKLGMVLDLEPSEGWFASWPRILVNRADPEKPWQMIYHAFNGARWRVYGAYSTDQGETWTRRSEVLLQGSEDDEEAWDCKGIGTRSIVPWRGGWLMVFEAVDKAMKHRLGTAFCEDPNGAGPWRRNESNPILEPGIPPMPEWTDVVVGTPFVVPSEDEKSLWLYYVGVGSGESDGKHAIGLLISESGELSTEHWTTVS